MTELTQEGQAIVLLCSALALPPNSDPRPLTALQFDKLRVALQGSEWRGVEALFGRDADEIAGELNLSRDLSQTIEQLLARGGQLGFGLTQLDEMGVWVLTLGDDLYPEKLKRRLLAKAPPVLFGAGPIELTNQIAVAIVGSRNVGTSGAEFTKRVAQACALENYAVISGGARGVDRTAMVSCLEENGLSIGVLADSLDRVITEREVRQYLNEERLCLLTPYLPCSRFNVGNAMGRNKLIYALAEYGVVADSSLKQGGTWEGAVENLRAKWVPLFVRDGVDAGEGNQELMRLGGIALREEEIEASGIRTIFEAQTQDRLVAEQVELTMDLFAEVNEENVNMQDGGATGKTARKPDANHEADVYGPMLEFLAIPRKVQEVADHFAMKKADALKILKCGVERKFFARVKDKPVSYQSMEAYRSESFL